jgi:ProP effector
VSESLGISKIEFREAIKACCAGTRYLTFIVEGAVRFDLEGIAAGFVTKIEANIAASRLNNRQQKNKKEPNVVFRLAAEQQSASS